MQDKNHNAADKIKKYLMAQKQINQLRKQDYYQETEENLKQIFLKYREAYREILNEIYRDTTQSDVDILNKEITNALKQASSPVSLFEKQIDLGYLRCFSGGIASVSVDFNFEKQLFLITASDDWWNEESDYSMTVDEALKAGVPGYIENTMSAYKAKVKAYLEKFAEQDAQAGKSHSYNDHHLERKRTERLRQMYEIENIERF